MLEAQPYATQSDAGQAAISEIRPQSSRRDFIRSAQCTSRSSHTSLPAKQHDADLSRVLVFSMRLSRSCDNWSLHRRDLSFMALFCRRNTRHWIFVSLLSDASKSVTPCRHPITPSNNSIDVAGKKVSLFRAIYTARKSCYSVSSHLKIKVTSKPSRLTPDTIPRTLATPNFSFKIGRRKTPTVAPSLAVPAANPPAVPRN